MMNAAERHHAREATSCMKRARTLQRLMTANRERNDVPRARIILSRLVKDARRHDHEALRARRLLILAKETTQLETSELQRRVEKAS
jgi:hypothetical protein